MPAARARPPLPLASRRRITESRRRWSRPRCSNLALARPSRKQSRLHSAFPPALSSFFESCSRHSHLALLTPPLMFQRCCCPLRTRGRRLQQHARIKRCQGFCGVRLRLSRGWFAACLVSSYPPFGRRRLLRPLLFLSLLLTHQRVRAQFVVLDRKLKRGGGSTFHAKAVGRPRNFCFTLAAWPFILSCFFVSDGGAAERLPAAAATEPPSAVAAARQWRERRRQQRRGARWQQCLHACTTRDGGRCRVQRLRAPCGGVGGGAARCPTEAMHCTRLRRMRQRGKARERNGRGWKK